MYNLLYKHCENDNRISNKFDREINFMDIIALEKASTKGHFEIVKYLYKNSAYLNLNDTSALNNASINGHIEIVKFLHTCGVNLNEHYGREIRGAVSSGHLDVVKYLFENGAKLDDSLLITASENGYLELVKYISKISNFNYSFDNPIYNASREGHLEVVKYLYENDVKGDLERAIQVACKNGHLEIVKYLYQKGVVLKDLSSWFLQVENLELIKFLLKVNKKETLDLIEEATINGFINTVKYLYNNGAILTLNLLRLASEYGHLDIIKYLHDNKLDFTSNKKCIYLASRHAHLDLVKYFIQYGIDIDNEYMINAFKNNDQTMIKYLYKHGGDITAVDSILAEYAKLSYYKDIIKFVILHGADINKIEIRFHFELKYYKKYKPIMDICIQQIHFNPDLERTKTENIEKLKNYNKTLKSSDNIKPVKFN